MQAPRYLFYQNSLFLRLNNIALIIILLIFWHRLHYLKCNQSYTLYYFLTQILVAYYSLAFFVLSFFSNNI